ncbi:YihY/virulence factor BrkB family protein [Ponticaulis sp.]|uniref:YihY/virulence factor BrkB family protein n=1 Tax=Ponticaulis sp. TaxID=2020902 RepID=UPI000B68B1C8|nr:YihY/virulence factor BrkB family protein [Ponticaulis sp.]MAI91008.1 hypothetical protein [Ponticaulis sp.]OUX98346.1 MAG: hypothetical protein CBB65_11225 [Hyphomonadaceae bacterium TMED5]|tara:strand:- start:132337 stop:133224 length:888 start_codon:yes stop_codon:yes gene_type:complete
MLERLKRLYHGSLIEHVMEGYSENDVPTRAAALAFYSFLSVFPFVALLVWISTASGSIETAKVIPSRFSAFLPPDFIDLIRDEIDHRLSLSGRMSLSLAIFHIVLLLLSSGAALRSMLFSFRQISDAEEVIGIFGIVWRSFLFVIPVLIFVVVASSLVAIITYVVVTLTSTLQTAWLVTPLLWLVVTAMLIGFLNAIYASGLIGRQNLAIHGWLGSSIAASCISVVTIALTIYFQINPVNREWYGSPGFLINVLLWFYACSLCLLMGAQINAALHGRKRKAIESGSPESLAAHSG